MSRILIGNSFSEELVGTYGKRPGTIWSHRLLWFAQDHDILVFPNRPTDEFLEYIATLKGLDLETSSIVVPPPGVEEGWDRLTADRVMDPLFRGSLEREIAGRQIEEVIPLFPDASIAWLAAALGIEDALPGAAFLRQGGGTLINSKAVFRAVAAGAGVPIPSGSVCLDQYRAQYVISDLLDQGHPVIVKRELRSAGDGNEIRSPHADFPPVGARRTVVVNDHRAVRGYLDQRWDWLSSNGRNRVVIEQYYPHSRAVFTEFRLTDSGCAFAGQGEMIAAPLADRQMIPVRDMPAAVVDEVIRQGRVLSAVMHAVGYRGYLSCDAIVTPQCQVLFSEYNGRITGSTHIYKVIGEQLVGPDYAERHHLWELSDWSVPSFVAARGGLGAQGLAYDAASRTGVILLNDRAASGTINYCVVADSRESAAEYRAAVKGIFEDCRYQHDRMGSMA